MHDRDKIAELVCDRTKLWYSNQTDAGASNQLVTIRFCLGDNSQSNRATGCAIVVDGKRLAQILLCFLCQKSHCGIEDSLPVQMPPAN